MIDPPLRAEVDQAIDRELARVRDRAGAMSEPFAALGDATARAAAGGKRLRPALVLAAFDAYDGAPARRPAAVDVAVAFELLHTAFVVHDDVIDHDVVRRGIPNIGGEFRVRGRGRGADAAGAATLGDAAAILAGDLLLHEAARLVALTDLPGTVRRDVYDLLDDAVYVSAAGELSDVENAVAAVSADTDDALGTAFNKTAVYSFRAPLCAGALLAGADAAQRELLAHAGGRLGLAFQLVDDLIGAFGTAEQAGREVGGDLREAKRTPLVAMARETAHRARVDDAIALAHTGPLAVADAQRAIEDSGARVELTVLAETTLARVRDDAKRLPTEAGALLRQLADRIEERIP
ncbi:polyprenyl synthetase family protein [Microbacterium awajiense]|uniref:Polyprenyl synthetase family protein n=1 Tax=Microbacterium awajiense TaxID=415214 RepID=A0ABP7AAA4_9MICO